MAVSQRLFNSTAPFCRSPQAELKGSYPPCSNTDQETEEEEEEGKEKKIDYSDVGEWTNKLRIAKLLTHGTAEQVGEKPVKTSTIVAQAECKYVCLNFHSNTQISVPGLN